MSILSLLYEVGNLQLDLGVHTVYHTFHLYVNLRIADCSLSYTIDCGKKLDRSGRAACIQETVWGLFIREPSKLKCETAACGITQATWRCTPYHRHD